MGRDTFGGPSACHITHQSVSPSYLDPVSGTVAERAGVIDLALLTDR